MFVTNWLEAVYLKQVAHPGFTCSPLQNSTFLIIKYPNFQSREPVRIRSRDDPTAGQSNIVVSRSPVQIPESAHFFFFFFFAFFDVF